MIFVLKPMPYSFIEGKVHTNGKTFEDAMPVSLDQDC